MTKKDNGLLKIEDFVRDILDKNFNQKIDPDTLRAAAKKIQVICAAANTRRSPRLARASSPDQKPCEPDRHC
ncbi:MAG: hypothetical protein ACREC9_16445 [Methylocella sp.]